MNIDNRVICPVCGAEYLPCEIFYPCEVFGSPDIVKDGDFKIISVSGKTPNAKETYCCDKCGKPLSLEINMSVNVSYDSIHDMSEGSELKLYKDRIKLSEE